MAQLSIYLDEDSLQKIRRAAEQEGKSVSEWVRDRLNNSLEEQWPDEYFDVFGALEENDLQRPEQIPFDRDRSREDV
jgi:hypothetical protein